MILKPVLGFVEPVRRVDVLVESGTPITKIISALRLRKTFFNFKKLSYKSKYIRYEKDIVVPKEDALH